MGAPAPPPVLLPTYLDQHIFDLVGGLIITSLLASELATHLVNEVLVPAYLDRHAIDLVGGFIIKSLLVLANSQSISADTSSWDSPPSMPSRI